MTFVSGERDQCEAFCIQPSNQRRVREGALQVLRDFQQQQVAILGVLREPFDLEHSHRDRRSARLRRAEIVSRERQKTVAAVEACEIVEEGYRSQCPRTPLALDRMAQSSRSGPHFPELAGSVQRHKVIGAECEHGPRRMLICTGIESGSTSELE